MTDLKTDEVKAEYLVKDTQEEKWLNEAQKGKRGVRWITSVDEINYDTIKLSNNAPTGTINADQIRIVSNNLETAPF